MRKSLIALCVIAYSLIIVSCATKPKFTNPGWAELMWGIGKNDPDFDQFKDMKKVALLPHFYYVPASVIQIASKEISISAMYMSNTEITNAQYLFFLNLNTTLPADISIYIDVDAPTCRIKKDKGKYSVEEGFENHPVVHVSHLGCAEYCLWLSDWNNKKLEDIGMHPNPNFRLPTYFEWNLAAFQTSPADTNSPRNYDEPHPLDEYAWYQSNSMDELHKVAQKKSTDILLYDLKGNAAEWVDDVDGRDYITGDFYNPSNFLNDSASVCGGSYKSTSDELAYYANRTLAKTTQRSDIGFRICKSVFTRSMGEF